LIRRGKYFDGADLSGIILGLAGRRRKWLMPELSIKVSIYADENLR
jgi:hypothetical protein